jgi:tripartite-type tricarboxylate transporter receptor subunit TctC
MRTCSPLLMVLASTTLLSSNSASGQSYPNKPIRIVTAGIGAAADTASRLLAPGLTANIKQQVVVDSRSAGVIPGEIVSKATPDGYTLLVNATVLWVGPLLTPTPYDVLRDFAPITMLTSAPNLLTVTLALPVRTVKELIEYAKAKPGELNYVSGATGSPTHMAAEMFNVMAGVRIVRITYKNGATQMTDLVAGQGVQVMVPNAATAMPYVKSNRLRALAVTSAKPSVLAPGLATVAASGLPGYEAETKVAFFAPVATPRAIVELLNRESVRYLQSPETRERFFNAGTEVETGTPQELVAAIKADIARWSNVIKKAGIHAD